MISTVAPGPALPELRYARKSRRQFAATADRSQMQGLPPAGEPRHDIPRGPAAAMFAADQASRGLGMELLHVGPGTAVVQMRVALQMLNGHSIGHGGYVFM